MTENRLPPEQTPTANAVDAWIRQRATPETNTEQKLAQLVENQTTIAEKKGFTPREINTISQALLTSIEKKLHTIPQYLHEREHTADEDVRFTHGAYQYKVHKFKDPNGEKSRLALHRRLKEHGDLSDEEEKRAEEVDEEYWDEQVVLSTNINLHDLKHRPGVYYHMTERFRQRPSPEDIQIFLHPRKSVDTGFAVSRAIQIYKDLRVPNSGQANA